MIALPTKAIRHFGDDYRRRPFFRMVELFVARVFRGGGGSDTEGLDLGMGLILTLLALPGGFVSILLFEKYGTLLQWMLGATNIDPLASSFSDEYFFIVLSMVVTGAVTVWRWDTIFPDRRDHMNLVPLPITTRMIFQANLVSVLLLAGLIAVDVNAASSILFPLLVGATQDSIFYFASFAAVHALGVVLASLFAFFAVFSALGLLMAVMPVRAFRRVSPYMRATVVIYLVTLLCTSFALPKYLQRLSGSLPSWTLLMPSCWFVGLCQSLRGRASSELTALGHLALPGVGVVALLAVCVYAVGYNRHFVRIPEIAENDPGSYATKMAWLTALLDRWVLRTPFQKGGFRFVQKTLFRNETHRLLLGGISGVGLVLASQTLLSAFQGNRARAEALLSAEALSVPFVLAFFGIVGLRIAFEIPVELPSNWVFRFMLDSEKHECESLARRVILAFILPWVLLVSFPVYVYLTGWIVGCLHTFLVVVWSVLLTNAALVRFRKFPFTCSLPLFQQHSIVMVLGCLLAFFAFAVLTPQLESWALPHPLRMIVFIPLAAVGWYIPHRIRKGSLEIGPPWLAIPRK